MFSWFWLPSTATMRNWRAKIFAYFDQPVTYAYTESANNIIRVMQRLGQGYSFEVLRAKCFIPKVGHSTLWIGTVSPIMDTMTIRRMLCHPPGI